MESLIETFHIDYRILIAQIINFGIVFAVLYFFALKPLMKIMAERTKKIEQGLNDAKEIERKLASTDEQYTAKMKEAKTEAAKIMEKAVQQAEEKRTEMINKAKEEIGAIINQEKAQMQSEKAKVLKEIKIEIAELVAVSLEKVLEGKLDEKKDREMIKKIVK